MIILFTIFVIFSSLIILLYIFYHLFIFLFRGRKNFLVLKRIHILILAKLS